MLEWTRHQANKAGFTIDDLKAQLNTYFEHLGENQYTRHLFGQMSCIDLGEDRDEYAWKTVSYMPWLIRDDSDVRFMFRNMVEDNILYMYVRSICNCIECKYEFNLMMCNELFNYGHLIMNTL